MSVRTWIAATAIALVACVIGAGTATALSSIGVSATAFTGTAANVTFNGSFGNVVCNMTLQGTLASRAAKVSGTSTGKVTAGSAGGCTSGGTTVLIGAGWPILFRYFTGTLPNIVTVGITILGFSIEITLGGFCTGLYRGDVAGQWSGTGTAFNRLNANSTVGNNTMTRVSSSGGICPATGAITGAWTITPTITVTLH